MIVNNSYFKFEYICQDTLLAGKEPENQNYRDLKHKGIDKS